MPEDSNETEDIDKILAELKNETVEEKPSPRDKKPENPYKDKKNDDNNEYEFSDDKDLSDDNW